MVYNRLVFDGRQNHGQVVMDMTMISQLISVVYFNILDELFQIFFSGDVVYAQTWEVLPLKNPIEPP